MQPSIQHDDSGTDGRFFLAGQPGGSLAEMTYRQAGAAQISIDHTHVDPSLRGRGVARTLLDALVAWARGQGLKVVPVCSYARAQFEKDASLRDVLAERLAN